MRVLVVGVGDAFTLRHFGSSLCIEGPDGHLLVDCPDLVRRALAEATEGAGWAVEVESIRDILITHLHGDHVNGLECLGFLQWLSRRRRPAPLPRLHMGPGAAARIWERLAPAMDQGGQAHLSDYFELHVLRTETPARIAGLEIRTRPTTHPVPTTALRISDGTRTLGYSADTPWEPALVEWLASSDLVIHETSPAPAHTPVEHLNGLPAALRRKMRLIHAPDEFDPASSDIALLRQGEVLTL